MGAGPGVLIGAQLVGSAMGAAGAYQSAAAQKQALFTQANLDEINARANASALKAQADLDTINAKSIYDTSTAKSNISELDVKAETDLSKVQIGMDLVSAQSALTSANVQAASEVLTGQQQALSMRTSAAVNAIKAGSAIESLNVGAQIADNTAHLAELQAQATLFQGQQQEQDVRMQGAQQKSHAVASMAARGIDLGEGSALQVQNTHDFMTERAAIQVQQKTLMAAFSYRQQEANAMIDAAGKRYQAGMAAASSALETGLTEAQATSLVANVNAAADLRRTLASITFSTAEKGAATKTEFLDAALKRQLASIDTDRALALAGFNNANASIAVKKMLAETGLSNALAAADAKRAAAAGINPTMAATTSLLSSAGQVAGSWYAYGKTTGKVS